MGIFNNLFKKKTKSQEPTSEAESLAVLDELMLQLQQSFETKNEEKWPEPISDEELLQYFVDYFSPNQKFYSTPGSKKHEAYFGVLNEAKMELVKQPVLYRKATGRNIFDYLEMINNPTPIDTNLLICGLIFCVGKYSVRESAVFCVDFSSLVPNCVALHLLLIAQKQPENKREQLLDIGRDEDPASLQTAINALRVLDPEWQPKILSYEGNIDCEKTEKSNYKKYMLKEIPTFLCSTNENSTASPKFRKDEALGKQVITFPLDEEKRFFLSVYFLDNSEFDTFCVDDESVSDSHYYFKNEKKIRAKLYQKGDEEKYLHEIFAAYIGKNGGTKLLFELTPYITATFRYD